MLWPSAVLTEMGTCITILITLFKAVDPVQIFVDDYDGDKICLQLADPVTQVCCFQCFVSGSAEKNAPGSGSSWADAFIGCFLICDDILCSF